MFLGPVILFRQNDKVGSREGKLSANFTDYLYYQLTIYRNSQILQHRSHWSSKLDASPSLINRMSLGVMVCLVCT